MQRTKYIILWVLVVLLGYFLKAPIFYVLNSRSFEKSFHILLKEAVAGEKILDLRKMNENSWDELVWVGPYENPCDQGLAFQEWWHPCKSTGTDHTYKIYFLNNQHVVAGFQVQRVDLEFTESAALPKRIPRLEAQFKFDHFEQFPTVQQYVE